MLLENMINVFKKRKVSGEILSYCIQKADQMIRFFDHLGHMLMRCRIGILSLLIFSSMLV